MRVLVKWVLSIERAPYNHVTHWKVCIPIKVPGFGVGGAGLSFFSNSTCNYIGIKMNEFWTIYWLKT